MSAGRRVAPPPSRVVGAAARVGARLGAQVHEQRTARRWTLRELARRAGMSTAGVHAIEAGQMGTVESYLRLADALSLRLDLELVDPRRRAPTVARSVDPVHAAMAEFEARHLRAFGYLLAIDEPYQHFQFAGRADLIAWDRDRRQLLHIENRTRFPNLQDFAGAYNAKRAYLGRSLAERLGVAAWRSETHVIAALWSSEVLHAIRLRTTTFRTLCPDGIDAFERWWKGIPPESGSSSALVVLDPFVTGRRRAYVALDHALSARPRVPGYAAAVARLGG
jgi:transcriptional regulator with XRE-family HTH domain